MNDQNLKPFRKGDPRINRKGRPKGFDGLRELAQQIAHEAVNVGDKKFTVVEAILRQWAQSKNAILQKGFLEIAYGKVPDEAINENIGEIVLRIVRENKNGEL